MKGADHDRAKAKGDGLEAYILSGMTGLHADILDAAAAVFSGSLLVESSKQEICRTIPDGRLHETGLGKGRPQITLEDHDEFMALGRVAIDASLQLQDISGYDQEFKRVKCAGRRAGAIALRRGYPLGGPCLL